MGYMRSFYEDNHFWELAPYETTDAGNLFANKAPLATANQDLSRIVAYFGDTVRRKLAIEGVPTGAHAFRHSLATRMLRAGAGLESVGTILRHRSPATTAIYAKVDVPMLLKVAQDWPGDRA